MNRSQNIIIIAKIRQKNFYTRASRFHCFNKNELIFMQNYQNILPPKLSDFYEQAGAGVFSGGAKRPAGA